MKATVGMRKKTEELLRQRFANVRAAVLARKDAFRRMVRSEIEQELGLKKLQEREKQADQEHDKTRGARYEAETRISEREENLMREVENAVSRVLVRLTDEESRTIEELWTGDLTSDLKSLLNAVPLAEKLLTGRLKRLQEVPEMTA